MQEDDRISSVKKDLVRLEKKSSKTLEEVNDLKNKLDSNYYNSLDDNSNLDDELKTIEQIGENIIKSYKTIFSLTDEMKTRWSDIKKMKKKKISPIPTNGVIDKEEESQNHFAKGMNLYKLLIICFVGSFFGVVIEMLWCLLKNGYVESRAGLVYGPFNLLYGVGAVLLTLCLYKFRNRGNWISFIGGMLVGSCLEYVCSWGQEMILGSRSWDYSQMAFNLNGRICLLYSVFWGFLGVFWIKKIYPSMAKCILKIPNKMGKILTYVITIFFVLIF